MKTPLGAEVDLGPGHVLDGVPALRERGTAAPSFRPCLLWPRSPISTTAELLLCNACITCYVNVDAEYRVMLITTADPQQTSGTISAT